MNYFRMMFLVIMFTVAGAVYAQTTDTTPPTDTTTTTDNSDTMSKVEFDKKTAEAVVSYENTLTKMTGNIEAYYLLVDYMGTGYVKLDTDIIIQIKNAASLKSDMWNLDFTAKDDANFSVKKNWKIKKSDIYINGEGDAVLVSKFSLEKGVYKNINISLIGNSGESAAIAIPEFKTLQLSDLTTKVGKVFLISSMDEVRNPMFYRRDHSIVPNLRGYYNKSKTFGFYFEYYHLTSDAMHNEGEYNVIYRLVNVVFDKEIFDQKINKKEVKSNGAVIVPPIDLTEAYPGVYRLDVEFTDVMSNVVYKQSIYFNIIKKEEAK